ncbi:RPA1 [Symbiodinium sp. CCMP2456]|nr:RPA1 [Symbiodinium sp. CCMP2456]
MQAIPLVHITPFAAVGHKRLDQADLEELAVGLKSEEHHELMETQSSSGILADFIEREKAKDGHWRLTNERWLFYFLATKPKLFVGSAADHARGILLREQLECDLAIERLGLGSDVPSGSRAMVAIGDLMSNIAMTIAAQVSNWEMNIKMLEWGYKEDDDVVLSRLHDRRLRHEGFWPATDFSDPEREESQPVDEPSCRLICGQGAKSDTFQIRGCSVGSSEKLLNSRSGLLRTAALGLSPKPGSTAVSKLPTSISKHLGDYGGHLSLNCSFVVKRCRARSLDIGHADMTPLQNARNLMNVVSQPSSIGRWAPPRPQSDLDAATR